MWFLDRFADLCHLQGLEGTPAATWLARALGSEIARGARFGCEPQVLGLLRMEAGATIEGGVDAHGWWIDGAEVVVGEMLVQANARVGTRTTLMPGAVVGPGAEVEPGSVVIGLVPAGELWSGSPAARVGEAGRDWPDHAPTPSPHRRAWKAMYTVGTFALGVIPLAGAAAALAAATLIGPIAGQDEPVLQLVVAAPLLAAAFIVGVAATCVILMRASSRFVTPGLHGDDGGAAWANWFSSQVMRSALNLLHPLYSTMFTRPWLRLLGVQVGRGTEVCHTAGLNHLVSIGEMSFLADDVCFAVGRSRGGWMDVRPITIGDRTFVGNGAILRCGTTLGDDCLVGVLSAPPVNAPDGTSWLGCPALELPRAAEPVDPRRTTSPPWRLRVARASIEFVRVLLPTSVAIALTVLAERVIWLAAEASVGGWGALLVAPFALVGIGIGATAAAIALKWALMGRYRPSEHPLWSRYIWLDELINMCHEKLAMDWLMIHCIGTPVMALYLRALGAKVGHNAWIGSSAFSDFDLVNISDGVVLNRHSVPLTHLFHDRLMRTGPVVLLDSSGLGPYSAVLPDAELGRAARVGARSIVLRGESLPPATRWHGAPVVAM